MQQQISQRIMNMKIRKQLSADSLFRLVRQKFGKIKEHRLMNVDIPLNDALMSAFALFSLKDSSLLAFDKRRAKPENLRKIFGIQNIPSDTQMRTIADDVDPDNLRPLFKSVFQRLQRGKVLEKMTFMGKYYLASIDGTGYFTSQKIHLPCVSTTEERPHRDNHLLASYARSSHRSSRPKSGDSVGARANCQTRWPEEE